MQLIDGKATAAAIKQEIAAESVKAIVDGGGKQPHLAAVLVGHDGGSETYVKNKVIACEQCGFKSTLIRYEDDVTEDELLQCVDRLNRDSDIDGFIVQLPLPKHIDEQKVIMAIDYRKDVDGFHPVNVGRMAIGLPCFISATPLGILTLLRRYNIPTSGKKCVVLGRSNIVGKPMAQLMMQKQYGDATVTVCHSHSATLKQECREADIIIAAIGRPGFVTADMVKEGAVIIDGTFLYHVGSDEAGAADGCNDDVGFTTLLLQGGRVGVAHGDRGIAILLLHHELCHGLAHDVAASEHHTFLSRGGDVVAAQQGEDAKRGG